MDIIKTYIKLYIKDLGRPSLIYFIFSGFIYQILNYYAGWWVLFQLAGFPLMLAFLIFIVNVNDNKVYDYLQSKLKWFSGEFILVCLFGYIISIPTTILESIIWLYFHL